MPTTLDELKTLGATDEEGRPRPDRLRRQGRLAGDGHLRHPQHADQRLRLPHQPDGRQGGVGGRQGQGRSSTPGPACCPTTSRTRSAAPGRRPRSRCVQKKAGMYLLGHCSLAAVHRARTATTSTSSRSPRSTPSIGADALDAPIDGFMMAPKPKNEAGAKELLEYLGSAEAAEHLPQDRPERRRVANKQARHERLHRAAEEGRRAHRLGRRTSPSSSTGTPGRTSPRP